MEGRESLVLDPSILERETISKIFFLKSVIAILTLAYSPIT
jgi:hypothetical protein